MLDRRVKLWVDKVWSQLTPSGIPDISALGSVAKYKYSANTNLNTNQETCENTLLKSAIKQIGWRGDDGSSHC